MCKRSMSSSALRIADSCYCWVQKLSNTTNRFKSDWTRRVTTHTRARDIPFPLFIEHGKDGLGIMLHIMQILQIEFLFVCVSVCTETVRSLSSVSFSLHKFEYCSNVFVALTVCVCVCIINCGCIYSLIHTFEHTPHTIYLAYRYCCCDKWSVNGKYKSLCETDSIVNCEHLGVLKCVQLKHKYPYLKNAWTACLPACLGLDMHEVHTNDGKLH